MSSLDRFAGAAGTPERAGAGGALTESGPARVSYSVTDHGDWSHLVPEIAAAVAAHLVGDRLGAWVNKTSTRRRGDVAYQSLSAWWTSDRVVVELSATRPLAPVAGKRFRPDGPWAAQALVHTLAPAAVAAKSWSRRSTSAAAGPAGNARLVQDSLEVLPEPLRRLTAGGPPGVSLLWDHGDGRETEEVMAYRVLERSAVVLAAWRGPASGGALEAETWHSRVVDTAVVGSQTHELRLPAGAAPRQEMPATARRLAEGARKALPWGRGR
jgi:hypothetical protein